MSKSSSTLQFQIKILQFELEYAKKRSEERINILEEEKKAWLALAIEKSGSQLEEQIQELEKSYINSMSMKKSDDLKEESLYKLHIGELKNRVSKKEARNASIVAENVELHQKYDVINGEYDKLLSKCEVLQPTFEKHMSSIIQRKIESHTSSIKSMSSLQNRIQLLDEKTKEIDEKITKKEAKLRKDKQTAERMEDAIKQLEKLYIDLSSIPEFAVPTPQDFVNAPEVLIDFVNRSGAEFNKTVDSLTRQYNETMMSSSRTMSATRRPPLSRETAEIIAKVGKTVVNLSEELKQEENDDSSNSLESF